jgi:O-antigen/teichoic acid export membrane protein
MALPLGISTTMAALNLNMPRYFIHAQMGERQLGIYSAMAYATVAMILVADSLGHCAIPRLSRLYAEGQLTEFRTLLLKLVAAGGGLGLAGLAVARMMGARLLTLLYGHEYAVHYQVFLVLILATAIHCAACMLTSAVTSARCFRIQVPLYALVVGSNAIACARWVPAGGLAGGAAAMAVAALVHLTLGAAVVSWLLRAPAKLAECPPAAQACVDDWETSL